MSTINTIILVGVIQGFFLSFLFFLKKNILFNKLFALILLCITTALLLAYLQNVLDFRTHTFIIKTSLPLPLIFIPGLLVYLKKLTGTYHNSRKMNLFLFGPLLIILLFNIPFYFGSDETKINYFIRNDLNETPLLVESIEGIFVELMVAVFSFIAIIESRVYKQRVKQIYSNLSKTKFVWIQFLAYSMFILTFFALTLSVWRFFSNNVPIAFNFVTAIGSTAAIYYIAYYLLVHQDALTDVSVALKSIDEKNDPNGETHKETRNETQKETKQPIYSDYERKIIRYLEIEKLYLNPDLTLAELSDKIGIPPYLTSKVISQCLNTNFFSLINKYRLQQVKSELLMPDNKKSIIEIAYQAGFNSKTTFYETFKKETGLSPSEFTKTYMPE